MKPGFLTACLRDVPLDALVPWAAAQGFQALELGAWPAASGQGHQAHHIDAACLTREEATRVKDLFARHGLGISSLAYYDNNLDPDPDRRAAHHHHLRKVIDAAALLGVDLVGTFVGASAAKPDLIIKEAGAFLREMVRYAEDQGVRLMIENCPMPNWVTFGLPGNYAYSPELWDALFDEVPGDSLGLNFDPSHLYWLGIDYDRAARDYASRIFHVHAKDTELLPEAYYRYGLYGDQLGNPEGRMGWWRYRMPGLGGIDWHTFFETLRSIGYKGAVSIEHEDPEYEGSIERVQEGLRLGLSFLKEQITVRNDETESR